MLDYRTKDCLTRIVEFRPEDTEVRIVKININPRFFMLVLNKALGIFKLGLMNGDPRIIMLGLMSTLGPNDN